MTEPYSPEELADIALAQEVGSIELTERELRLIATVRAQWSKKYDELQRQLAEAWEAAAEMSGFVKPYGLSDRGPGSEYEQWKACRSRIAAAREKEPAT